MQWFSFECMQPPLANSWISCTVASGALQFYVNSLFALPLDALPVGNATFLFYPWMHCYWTMQLFYPCRFRNQQFDEFQF